MSKHTPTPWRLSGKGTIRAGTDDWIGTVHWHNRSANAAFIITACNAHEAMKDALIAFVNCLDGVHNYEHLDFCRQKAIEALALCDPKDEGQ